MIERGFPHEQDYLNKSAFAVEFPKESPVTSIFRDQTDALEQLELWKVYQDHWCEHKPSCTVYVKEHEWWDVGAWVYRHFDNVSGVSFLPYDNGTYRQAPYEEIVKDEYEKRLATMPKCVDWLEMKETQDTTTGSQELACTAGVCEL